MGTPRKRRLVPNPQERNFNRANAPNAKQISQRGVDSDIKKAQPMLKPLLVLFALLFLTSQISFAQAPTPIIVAGPPDEGFKDVYFGVQSGLFAKYGLDVQPRIVHGGAVVLAGLSGGSYDVAFTNLVPVLQAHG